MSAKRGRPPNKRTAIEPIAPALWMRLLQDAAGAAKDPRLGTEIGRLCAAGRMTATEATAAFRVAEIYGRYERMAGLNRSSKSPSYEVGYGGGGNAIEGEHDEQAKRAWNELQSHIPTWPTTRRRDLETLAVENRCIGPMELNEVRSLLQTLATHFRITSARDNSPAPQPSARAPTVKSSTGVTKLPRSEIDREALHGTLLKVNPNLQLDELLELTNFFFALKERKRFQQDKASHIRKLS